MSIESVAAKGCRCVETLEIDGSLEKVTRQREAIEIIKQKLHTVGALCLTGCSPTGCAALSDFFQAVFGAELMDYNFRSTPRTKLRFRIYTSSEYHQDTVINLHNENSYTNTYPNFVGFHCVRKSTVGGENLLAEGAEVLQRIDPAVRDEFESRGVRYIRNYIKLDLPWSEVFQTSSRLHVEQYCRDNSISFTWIGENDLRTEQRGPVTAFTAGDETKVWFNVAHMFHPSVMGPVGEAMKSLLGEEYLPRNVKFNDGGHIPDSYIRNISSAYEDSCFFAKLETGDVLLLDNIRYAHGRRPYSGDRKMLFGMARPIQAIW